MGTYLPTLQTETHPLTRIISLIVSTILLITLPSATLACWEPEPEPEPGTGTLRVIGPSGDPWYRFVGKYDGERRAKMVVRVNGKRIVVKRFENVCRTGWQRIRPGTRIVVTLREMGTNRLLDREVVRNVPAGWFGPLYRGFTIVCD